MKKVIAYFIFICVIALGIFFIYRAEIKLENLKAIDGKIISKQIIETPSRRGRLSYCLAFNIEGLDNLIAININSESDKEKNNIYDKFSIGKVYRFYLDPTIPTSQNINWGIRKVDFKQLEIYKSSNKLDIFFGIFLILMSSTLIYIIAKSKKTPANSKHKKLPSL